MKHLKRFWNKILSLPLFSKLVGVNILLVAFPLIFIVTITYRELTMLNQKEFNKYSMETVHQVSNSISVIFNELNLMSNVVLTNKNVQEALSYPKDGYEKEKLDSYNRVNSDMNVLFNSRMSYTSLIIYGYNGQLFYRGISSADYYFDYDNYLSELLEKPSKKYMGSHYREYSTDGKLVFSLAVPILSTSDFEPLGYMILDLDYAYFNDLINDINYADNSDILIVDENQILFSKYKDNVHQPLASSFRDFLYSAPSGSELFTGGDETNFYSFCPIGDTNWKVVSVHSLSSYTNKSSTIFNFMLVAAGISLLVSILILVPISSAITKPLKKLTALMASVQNGNFNVRFHPKHEDEVGKLGHSFNYMLSYTNTLIDNVYKLQIAEKEATIFALQSQINPHFLYNTLQMISDFAEIGDDGEVSTVCGCLSSIFRYSIDGKSSYVMLNSEIEHVENYTYIQAIRLNHRFIFYIDVPDECRNIMVPRLILQPLVENSITHGIFDRLKGAQITVSAILVDHILTIRVWDNGVGIPPDQLAQIKAQLNTQSISGDFNRKSIGIQNVNHRLILNYGPQYSLCIESIPEEGTTVIIRIPVNQERSDSHV